MIRTAARRPLFWFELDSGIMGGEAVQNQSDREYFAQRAVVERHMSATASDPNAAYVHEQLADHYEKMVASAQRPRPKLSIAVRG